MAEREALKGHLDLLILAALDERPAHGYALVEALRGASGGVFTLPEGTIYPALHRLERSGLLTSRWSDESGRRRRIYELTARGRRELGRRRGEWRRFAGAVEAVVGGAA
jgi:PadR family transcriptional regulator PadR